MSAQVKTYSLTGLAENAAVYGLDSLFKRVLSKEIKILPHHAFMVVLGIEIERIKRYKISTSSVVLFKITDMDTLYLQLGKRTKDIFGEMSIVFKSILRTSDITTSLNESTFLSMMPETHLKGHRSRLPGSRKNSAPFSRATCNAQSKSTLTPTAFPEKTVLTVYWTP